MFFNNFNIKLSVTIVKRCFLKHTNILKFLKILYKHKIPSLKCNTNFKFNMNFNKSIPWSNSEEQKNFKHLIFTLFYLQ